MSNPTDLDVTAEEQRFLRQTFHRMALPYAAVIVLALVFFALSGPEDAEPEDAEPIAALRADVDSLRATLGALDVEVKRADSERATVSKKLGALQGRLSAGSGGEVVALERAVEGARKSIADLESRVAREAAAERLAALSDRIARLEREVGPRVVAPTPSGSPEAPPAASAPAPDTL